MENHGESANSDLANFLANFDAAGAESATSSAGDNHSVAVHPIVQQNRDTNAELRDLLDQLATNENANVDNRIVRLGSQNGVELAEAEGDGLSSARDRKGMVSLGGDATVSDASFDGQPMAYATGGGVHVSQQQLIIPIDANSLQTQADGTQTVLLPIVPTLMPDGRIEMRIAGSNIPIALSNQQQAQIVMQPTMPPLVRGLDSAILSATKLPNKQEAEMDASTSAVEEDEEEREPTADESDIDHELLRIVRAKRHTEQTVTVPKQLFKCQYCDYTNDKRYLLIRHLKSHSEDRPFQCPLCERGFKTNSSLNNHVNTHTGKKSYACTQCPSTFTTSGELLRHQRYRHTLERPHRCPHCDYATVELSKLKRHIRSHTGEKPYKCELCEYSSVDTYKMKRHMRTHTGDRPYECDLCLQRFTQSNTLKTHKLTHAPHEHRPTFKCDLCPATCGRRTDLRFHVAAQHTPTPRPIRCSKCADVFSDRYTFKQHWQSHKGEKCFRCALCDYQVGVRRHLEQHMLVHGEAKPFRCTALGCCRQFKQEGQLKRHYNLRHDPLYRIKSAEKRNICEMCGRMFRHAGNLLRHVELHRRQGAEVEITEYEETSDAEEEDENGGRSSALPVGDAGSNPVAYSADSDPPRVPRKPTVRLFAFSKEPMVPPTFPRRRGAAAHLRVASGVSAGAAHQHRVHPQHQGRMTNAAAAAVKRAAAGKRRKRHVRPEDWGMTDIKRVGMGRSSRMQSALVKRQKRKKSAAVKLRNIREDDDAVLAVDVNSDDARGRAERRRRAVASRFGFDDRLDESTASSAPVGDDDSANSEAGDTTALEADDTTLFEAHVTTVFEADDTTSANDSLGVVGADDEGDEAGGEPEELQPVDGEALPLG